jgi:hypothetical protein
MAAARGTRRVVRADRHEHDPTMAEDLNSLFGSLPGGQTTKQGSNKEGHMAGDDNLQRMKTLDDAWNAQDWDVFRKRHSSDTAVHWPGQPDPTLGRDAHQAESEAFFKSIENHLDNNPYKVMFRLWRLDLHDRQMDGKDDRPVARAGREGPSGDRKDVRARVLHSRPMEERGDRRGKPVLRPSRLSETNRRVIGRGSFGCSRQFGG